MERRFRLTSSTEIKRVRRSGRSYAHPLVVLIIKDVKTPHPRFAITAGTTIGNAVMRNRAKRILRAALQELVKEIQPGYHGILIARKPLAESNSIEANSALDELFREAGIYLEQ